MNDKQIFVAFVSKKLENEFELLKDNSFDNKLYEFIDRAISDLKKDSASGIKIPKNLWPKEYIKRYNITNLWKYDLPNGWRLIYTIKTDEITIISVILEWFNHKDYEKRFKY
ncbi:MAG: hypothetical protein V1824_03545 [archaeon]